MARSAFLARRVWRPHRLVAELAEYEPRTTALVADLTASRMAPWRVRCWAVRDGGRLAGVAAVSRWTFDEWHGAVYVADAAVAAPALAAVLDRSAARTVTGWACDVRPIAGRAHRVVALYHVPCVVLPPPVTLVGEPDDSTRLATLADLEGLTALYEGYELFPVPTRWQLRRLLRRMLVDGLVIVAEREGSFVGAGVIAARTTHWGVLDAVTVLPEHRRSGVAWAIAARAQALGNAMGIGGIFMLAATNPMPLDHLAADETLATAAFVARRRFPGQGRLRQLYARMGRRRVRRGTQYRELGESTGRIEVEV
jgi:N-acetylglutamate synthase-like GNAT family acetyltransferase